MRILTNEISAHQSKAGVSATDLAPTYNSWSPTILEGGPGYWQRGITVDRSTAFRFPALFACITGIAADMSKLGVQILRDAEGISQPHFSPAFSPVLTTPNRYQNIVQFNEHWALSKLSQGNTYALKVRDNRGVVRALYILDPNKVQPVYAHGAAVFYELQAEKLSTIGENVRVPADEIIHDRFAGGLLHPIMGVTPIMAAAAATRTGLEIIQTSKQFFENGAMPSGILSAPGEIGSETATRLKVDWKKKFGGANRGDVAVLGDGLKYDQMTVNPVDAQLIQQLEWDERAVCTVFRYPPYKIGVGEMPKYDNVRAQNENYFSETLQKQIVDYEAVMSRGLSLPPDMRVNLNIEDLLRMNPEMQINYLDKAVKAKLMTPNEGRAKIGLGKTPGGDSIWGQQQDHSLEALAERDRMFLDGVADLSGAQQPTEPPLLEAEPADDDEDDDEIDDDDVERAASAITRAFA